MAAIFQEILNPSDGEQMMPAPLVGQTDVEWMPSPDEYKRKVLIKVCIWRLKYKLAFDLIW